LGRLETKLPMQKYQKRPTDDPEFKIVFKNFEKIVFFLIFLLGDLLEEAPPDPKL
jgi:hypothetical protein